MVMSVVMAFIISATFSVLFGVKPKHVPLAGLAGAAGYLVYLLAAPLGSFTPHLLYGATTAMVSEIAARLQKAPAALFLAAGLVPIVPGSGIYNSVLLALDGKPMDSAALLYTTLLQVGAIAVGLILVSSLLKLLPVKRSKP